MELQKINPTEPEWNAENMNRKRGDTTFEVCGWCKYQGTGSYRYNTMLSGNCNLLKSYQDDVIWNTKCKVKGLGKKDIESLIRNKEYEIRNSESSIKSRKAEIKVLKDLRVKDSPPLPDNRTQDFKCGEIVYVFHEEKWNRGTVVMGYRSGDGCVSYVLDDYPGSKTGWGCGTSVPCVLKEWEYKYFKKNLTEFKTWLNRSDRKYNGEHFPIDEYFKALKAN